MYIVYCITATGNYSHEKNKWDYILEWVVKLVHIYGLGEKKCPLPTYTFTCATVIFNTIVTI